jgi:hypothetical protein
MDQGFFLRAQRLLGRDRPAAVDHGMLSAALAAHQESTRTARAEASLGRTDGRAVVHEPLPELILAGRCWREAAAAQGGCFNRSIAGRSVNGS